MIYIDPEALKTADMRDVLKYALKKFDGTRFEQLEQYYRGKHPILNRKMADDTKPNNQLVANLPAYIVDTITGYFMGKPVAYTFPEGADGDAYRDRYTEICALNNEQDQNAELSKQQAIKGACYELVFADEGAEPRFVLIPREGLIYIETSEIDPSPAVAIRPYLIEDLDGATRQFYEVYTHSEIILYEYKKVNGVKTYVEINRKKHYFGDVPVICYPNNKEMMGDFEGVQSLIDAYNISISDTANDLEYFTDAYLKMIGAVLDEEQVRNMKENRVIILPDKECDVDWLVKSINDQATENHKNRLREDIHTMSKCPDLTSDEFGSALSGVAIAYRMMNLEQVCAVKERKFKTALQRRLMLITNFLNKKGKNWDWRDIEIQFTRNLPQNIKELAEIVSSLAGHVDRETLLALLPFVDDPAKVLEKLATEKEEAIDLKAYMDDEDDDEFEQSA